MEEPQAKIKLSEAQKARKRFARETMIVVNVFQAMMQRLAKQLIDPKALHNIVMANPKLLSSLTKHEKVAMEDLPNGYAKCDMIFLYKLLRITNILTSPKSGFGRKPLPTGIGIEDDVERLRLLRNDLCHIVYPSVSEEQHSLFCQTVIAISKRWDSICGSAFENKIGELLSDDMDEDLSDKYIKEITEIEELKLITSVDGVNIYYGKGIAQQLEESVGNIGEEEKHTPLKIVIKFGSEVDAEETVKKLNAMKDELNSDNFTISFKSASLGSIVITASVKWYGIREHEDFKTELVSFLRCTLQSVGKQLKDYIGADIVVVVDSNPDDCKEKDATTRDWKGKRKLDTSCNEFLKSMKSEPKMKWLDHEMALQGYEDATEDLIFSLPDNITTKQLITIVKTIGEDRSNSLSTVLVKKDNRPANFLKKFDFDIESVRNKEVQIEAAKSVGIIRGPKSSGTGWRVGLDYVITAWHVVKDNADLSNDDIADKIQNDSFNIQFHYKEESQFDTSKFKFEKIVFFDDDLDTAILKLSWNGTNLLPPEIKKFRKISKFDNKELCIIGHPLGKPQTVDSKIKCYQLDEEDLEKAKDYSKRRFSDGNGYHRINDSRFILYNCYSTHGALGSVGIVIEENHKEPVAVLMHLRGFPHFAYDGKLHENEIQDLKDNGDIIEVEQGVKIESIFAAMETKHSDLRREIFGNDNQFR